VFAALVLVAVAAGKTNAWTALGAQLFFWGRIAHLATYIAGLVPWRTLGVRVAIARRVAHRVPAACAETNARRLRASSGRRRP
jgi:uncharacterized MAPEG superfamily protein